MAKSKPKKAKPVTPPPTENGDDRAFRKASKGGRITKLTSQVIDLLCTYLNSGAYIETAAAAAGIPKGTFLEWMRRGRDEPKTIYGKLSSAVDATLAKAELDALDSIKRHGMRNWQAEAWRLSRRFPGRWSPTHRQPTESEQETDNDFTLNYNLNDEEQDAKP